LGYSGYKHRRKDIIADRQPLLRFVGRLFMVLRVLAPGRRPGDIQPGGKLLATFDDGPHLMMTE
jgi:hypothetical protein